MENNKKGSFIMLLVWIGIFVILSGCIDKSTMPTPTTTTSIPTATPTPGPAPKIDRVGFPESYETNFTLFYVFDRPDNKQVRVVYANDKAASVKPGQPFPNGSILVMETHRAKQDAQGNVQKDGNGHYIRDQLLGIFVMRKELGFGVDYQNLRTGEWEYAAYRPNKTYLTPPQNTFSCAACHLALSVAPDKDFIFRGNIFFKPDKYDTPIAIGQNEILISSMAFGPATLQVKVGTTVRWVNHDVVAHTVFANDQSFTSAVLDPGTYFNYTFSKAGIFEYVCGIHPQQMKAKIEVKE